MYGYVYLLITIGSDESYLKVFYYPLDYLIVITKLIRESFT